MEIYKDRFSDAGDFSFVFAGSFEIEKIKPLLARYLGSLPNKGIKEEARDLKLDIAKGMHSRKILKGKEQQARVVLMLGGEYTPDEATNAQLSTLAALLKIRLTERLREEESGVYTVSADAKLRKRPRGEYVININFVCDPKNVETLIISAFSEISKVKRDGALQEDIDKIRAAAKQQKPRVLKENGFWLGHISTNVLDKTENEIEKIFDDSQWKKITPETLQATAIKYLSGENYMRFVLLPEVTTR
jgi:zinc protease